MKKFIVLIGFILIAFIPLQLKAGIVDGPANVRDKPNGQIVLSLNHGVYVKDIAYRNKWHLIEIEAFIDDRQKVRDYKLDKDIVIYDRQGEMFGKTTGRMEIVKNMGIHPVGNKFVVRLRGYTHQSNLVQSKTNNVSMIIDTKEKTLMAYDKSDDHSTGNFPHLDIEPRSIAIKGKNAFVVAAQPHKGSSFLIFDISDAQVPHVISCVNIPGNPKHLVVNGHYAFIAAGRAGLRIINISDYSSPIEVSYVPALRSVEDVAVNGNFIYIADGGDVRVIDVSRPPAPIEISSYKFCSSYDHQLSTRGSLIFSSFCTAGDGRRGIFVWDISNPRAPVEVGYLKIDSTDLFKAGRVFISDRYAYIPLGRAGLKVFDITDPSKIRQVSYLENTNSSFLVFVTDKYAYVLDSILWIGIEDFVLRKVDISNPSSPKEIAFLPINGNPLYLDIAVDKNNAYIAANWAGLKIVDVETYPYLLEVGEYSPIYYGRARLKDNSVYIAQKKSLKIYEISDSSSLSLVGYFNDLHDIARFEVIDDYAYIIDYVPTPTEDFSRLKIIKLSKNVPPREVGRYKFDGTVKDLQITKNLIQLDIKYTGKKFIDITRKDNPHEVAAAKVNWEDAQPNKNKGIELKIIRQFNSRCQ